MLIPAGAVFLRMDETPDGHARPLWNYLRNFKQVLPQSLARDLASEEEIPPIVFDEDSLLNQDVANTLLATARKVADSARQGEIEGYSEARWKENCHTTALSTLKIGGEGAFLVFPEEEWIALTVPPDVLLGTHKPDYSVAYVVNDSSPIQRDLLEASIINGCNPFINEVSQFAFPLAVAESKSNMASSFEADNECAQSAIKMLYKLSMLSETASSLPVFGMSLVGSNFTVRIVTRLVEGPRVRYRFQKMWSGDVSYLWASMQFQLIVWKLARWIRGEAMAKVLEELQLSAS